jgi:hypothetical protein
MNNLFLILGVIKSLTPYIKKYLIKQLSFHEFLLINNLFIFFFVFLISIYYYFYEKETFENLKNINTNNILLIGFIAFLTVFSSFIFSKLNVSNIGIITLLLKLFTNIIVLMLGYVLFNEKLSYIQFIGILFCLIGIYLTNKK